MWTHCRDMCTMWHSLKCSHWPLLELLGGPKKGGGQWLILPDWRSVLWVSIMIGHCYSTCLCDNNCSCKNCSICPKGSVSEQIKEEWSYQLANWTLTRKQLSDSWCDCVYVLTVDYWNSSSRPFSNELYWLIFKKNKDFMSYMHYIYALNWNVMIVFEFSEFIEGISLFSVRGDKESKLQCEYCCYICKCACKF